ncbi:MAG: hypothetical protein Q9201_005030 [Fulgogasparrea decipioides]
MAVEMNLNYLSHPLASTDLSLPVRRAIVNGIFQSNLAAQVFSSHDKGLQAWFSDWFEEQCEAAGNQASARTHGDLLHILRYLQSLTPRAARDEIANGLCTTSSPTRPVLNLSATDERLNASLTLAARIWLSVSVDSLQHFLTPGHFVCWNRSQPLSDAVEKEFCPKAQTVETVKLPRIFTAANLEQIAGIQVQWTSNLADHLSLKDDDKKVMLFYQASFLELSKESKSEKQAKGENRTLLNDDLIDETFRTLGLLIPSSDARSRKWFAKKQRILSLDTKAGSYGPLNASARQIEKFHYWRDRLVILKQTFDDSEPNTIASWWYDDRKMVQWYTFWVAAFVLLLTIVFGLIQSVSAVVQAWAAVKAVKDR